jgi:hypothetical protein
VNPDCYYGDHEWRRGVCIGCGKRFRCACGQFQDADSLEDHAESCPWVKANLVEDKR